MRTGNVAKHQNRAVRCWHCSCCPASGRHGGWERRSNQLARVDDLPTQRSRPSFRSLTGRHALPCSAGSVSLTQRRMPGYDDAAQISVSNPVSADGSDRGWPRARHDQAQCSRRRRRSILSSGHGGETRGRALGWPEVHRAHRADRLSRLGNDAVMGATFAPATQTFPAQLLAASLRG